VRRKDASQLTSAFSRRRPRRRGPVALAAAAAADEMVEREADPDEFLLKEVADRGRQPNLSFFAFTATPKHKTLELFGTRNNEGNLEPFHVYSMRQAIEENFILDVLCNYTTYKTYWKLAKDAADDPDVDRARAARALARFVSLHPHNLAQKAEVIIEHFHRSTRHKIGGRAKAMVVTRSRLHAVRYKQAVDRYLHDHGYHNVHTLVAFSGKVIDENALEFTEAQMNDGLPEARLPDRFASDDYQLLIVAEKYQTGYDQPLLHTMYVDKKLEGVKAVQTLSRLNRAYTGRDDTFILDFANEAEDIQKAFAPFFETTIAEPTDPNLIYQAQNDVESFGVVAEGDVDAFVALFAEHGDDPTIHPALYKHLEPARQRFLELDDQHQDDFRAALGSFVRLYAFLAQVVPFADTDLEKLYLYGRFLALRLPHVREHGLDLSDEVVLTHLRTELQATRNLSLAAGNAQLAGFSGEAPRSDPQTVPLSEIIDTLNERFGTEFTGADKVYFDQLVQATVEDDQLGTQARVNTLANWSYVFKRKFDDIVVDRRDANEELFHRFIDDPEFADAITQWVMRQAYERFRKADDDQAPGPG
jgi:type I restriction enzyme R subunit